MQFIFYVYSLLFILNVSHNPQTNFTAHEWTQIHVLKNTTVGGPQIISKTCHHPNVSREPCLLYWEIHRNRCVLWMDQVDTGREDAESERH